MTIADPLMRSDAATYSGTRTRSADSRRFLAISIVLF